MGLWLRFSRGVGVAAVVLGAVVAACSAGALISAGPAFAQSESSIIVQGNRRVEAATIRNYFRVGPGERLDAVRIDEAYKALLATGLFEDVQISQQGGRIVVTVIEAAVINRIQFEGNRQVKDEQLQAETQ
ncbi:MAG: outer membrane protein assembly factor BamA, partial [Variibacter sp.]|nr:outer membrane protein assembly factor BamA [Variibacter sp.]